MSTNYANASFEEMNDAAKLEREAKVRKTVLWSSIAVVVVALLAIFYFFGIRKPAIQKGDELIALADAQMAVNNTDSALVLYQQVVADNSYASGQRARVQAASILYDKGEYAKALELLEDASLGDEVIAVQAIGLKADCLANLDRLDEAVKAFDKAIGKANENPQLTPYFMEKKATLLEAQKKYTEAAAVLDQMIKEYPAYADQIRAEGLRTQMEALSGK